MEESRVLRAFEVAIDNLGASRRDFALRVAEASRALRRGVYPLQEGDLETIADGGYYGLLAEALRLEELQGEWITIPFLLRLVKAGREDLADQCLAIPASPDSPEQHNWAEFSVNHPEELNEKTIRWIEKHVDVKEQFLEDFSDNPYEAWKAAEDYFEICATSAKPDYDPYVGAWLTGITGLGLNTSLLEYEPPSALGLERMDAAGALDFSLADLWDAGIEDLIRSGTANCRVVRDLAQGRTQDVALAEAVERMRLIIRARGERNDADFETLAGRLNCRRPDDRDALWSLLFS